MGNRIGWAILLVLLVLPLLAGEEKPALKKTSPLAETGPRPRPVAAPPAAEIDAAIGRGLEFLLKTQNKNGSWGSADIYRPGDIYAPVPGSHHAFRAAVTAMCISALIEVGGDRPEIVKSLDRAETWLFQNLPHVRRATPDVFYNVWTHAYSLQALAHMLGRKTDDADRARKIHELIRQQIDLLDRYETVDGGWGYYDFKAYTKKPSDSSNCFVTAAVLIGLAEAKKVGEDAPQRLIDRGKASIIRQRKPDFAYDYGEYLKYVPQMPINMPGGSLGRSQACNAAMRIWGDAQVTDAIIINWLDRLFARNGWLDMGRKRPVPHESWFQVAGYFFYFGHYYAARCIELLPEADHPAFQDQLAHVLLAVQEKDGSWWDFPLYNYHQQYGTAFALMSLGKCRHAAEKTGALK
ncbi:MAG: prenyltransferase/squalene oxidase repeat-containing protein [Thermoguttaceae bacterium]|jgi:hypothetical protein